MALDLAKPVLTRDGREARIVQGELDIVIGRVRYPVCAEIQHPTKPGLWARAYFTMGGRIMRGERNDASDLVNYPWTPPPREAPLPYQLQRTANNDTRCLMHYVIAMLEHQLWQHFSAAGHMLTPEARIPRGLRTYEPNRINEYYVINIPFQDEHGVRLPGLKVNVSDYMAVLVQIVEKGYLDNVWLAVRLMGEGMSLWETEWSRQYADIMDKSIKPTGLM